MTEKEASTQLILTIDLGKEVHLDELDLQTRNLREELLDLRLESVDLVKALDHQEGAKSAEAVKIGALTLAVLPEIIPKLVEYLQSWTMRADHRKVKIKTQVGDRSIELEYSPSGLSSEELKVLINTLTGALSEQ